MSKDKEKPRAYGGVGVSTSAGSAPTYGTGGSGFTKDSRKKKPAKKPVYGTGGTGFGKPADKPVYGNGGTGFGKSSPTGKKPVDMNKTNKGFVARPESTYHTNPQSTGVRSRTLRRNAAEEAIVDPTQYTKTLEDFIAQARLALSSTNDAAMSGISGREGALKSNAAGIRGDIGGQYKSLAAYMAGQAPSIAQNYQTGIDQTAAAGKQATDAIQQSSAGAQSQQQAILSRLGIEDANVAIANQGGTLESQAATNVNDSAQRTQAASQRLSSNQATAQNLNVSSGEAAQLQGQQQQNRISQDLTSRLGALQDERAATASNTESSVQSLAQNLYNNDYNQWQGNYDRKYNVQKDAQSAAMEQTQMENDAAAALAESNAPAQMDATGFKSLGANGQAAYALQQSGVDPQSAKTIVQAVQDTYAAGGTFNSFLDFAKLINAKAKSNGLDPIDTNTAAGIYYNYFQ